MFGIVKRRTGKSHTTIKCEGKGKTRRCCVYEKPFTGESVPKRCWRKKPKAKVVKVVEIVEAANEPTK